MKIRDMVNQLSSDNIRTGDMENWGKILLGGSPIQECELEDLCEEELRQVIGGVGVGVKGNVGVVGEGLSYRGELSL